MLQRYPAAPHALSPPCTTVLGSARLPGWRKTMQRTYRAIVIATLGIGLAVAPSVVHATCVGDCGGTGSVQINDLILMVNIALGNASLSTCMSGDADASGEITINEIILAVGFALAGCEPSQ